MLTTWQFLQIQQPKQGLEQAAGCIDLYVNANKTEYMCYKPKGAISTLSRKPLELVNQFTYLGSSISSTEGDVNIRLVKT